MSTLNSRVVRSKISVRSDFGTVPILDLVTNKTVSTVRGNATTFQFGFFDPTGAAFDLSLVQSINFKIKPSQTPSDTTLADQTLASGDLDLTMDAGTWADGTKQHAAFIFSNAEMNLTLGGIKKNFWMVVTAILSDGGEVTLCGGNLIFVEDNNATADPPPENAGTFLTLEQGDARYQQIPAPLALTAPPINGTLQQTHFSPIGLSATSGGNVTATLTSADLSGSPLAFNVPVNSGENGPAIVSGIETSLTDSADFNSAFTLLNNGSTLTISRVANGNDSTLLLVLSDPNGVLSSSGPFNSLSTSSGIAGTVGTALGQLAIVTAQGGNTSPKIERDVFTLTLLSPLTWTPPGNLYQDPDSGFWYRQAILPGGGGAVDFGLAYT